MKDVDLELPDLARQLDARVLSDHVHAAPRDAICDGRIAPFTRLIQNDIAAQLSVSRTPVREACIRLSQEGLVRAVPGRGFVVLDVTEQDILEVYQVRIAVEVMAVGLIEFPLAPAVTARLRALHETIMRKGAEGLSDYYELNREFHMTLVRESPNRLAVRMLDELWDAPISQRIFKSYVEEGLNIERMNQEHEAIVQAAEVGDRELLVELVGAHLRDAREHTKAWLETEGVAGVQAGVG
jgi:DNA-binding GntR family transcriptional regulator